MNKKADLTNTEKKAILLKHYGFDEICEIMGYDDCSNEDVYNPEMILLEHNNPSLFEEKMLDAAIINGNFEDVIRLDLRMPI